MTLATVAGRLSASIAVRRRASSPSQRLHLASIIAAVCGRPSNRPAKATALPALGAGAACAAVAAEARRMVMNVRRMARLPLENVGRTLGFDAGEGNRRLPPTPVGPT